MPDLILFPSRSPMPDDKSGEFSSLVEWFRLRFSGCASSFVSRKLSSSLFKINLISVIGFFYPVTVFIQKIKT